MSVLCGWGVPHSKATARVPSPHPHRTRPYQDTEQLILLRRLCKGGSGVVRSGDPCGRPGVGLWLLSLTPLRRDLPRPVGMTLVRAYYTVKLHVNPGNVGASLADARSLCALTLCLKM